MGETAKILSPENGSSCPHCKQSVHWTLVAHGRFAELIQQHRDRTVVVYANTGTGQSISRLGGDQQLRVEIVSALDRAGEKICGRRISTWDGISKRRPARTCCYGAVLALFTKNSKPKR